jgi:hypothetical protein
MEAAKRLAEAGERSEIARTARSGLFGLRASLIDAVGRCPQDAGRPAALDLIGQLDEILVTWPARGKAATAGERPWPAQDRRLRDLTAEFIRDPAAGQHLDKQSFDALAELAEAGDDAALWRGLHLSLLRLPEQLATGWRGQLAALTVPPGLTRGAAGVTGQAAPGWRTLPAEREAILVPGYAGAEGIRTSASAPADREVLAALGLSGAGEHEGDAAALARLGSLVLGLTELDENLVLCLDSVLFMGSRRLDEKYRQLYRAELLGRLGEYQRREPDSAACFEALVDIDEAVNSLIHRPPAAAGSWWAQVRQRSRRMVDRAAGVLNQAGADVEVLPLGLRYRDVRDFTAGNDVASHSGGEPGDVLACLRVWTRIGDKKIPGRVMYRV